MIKLHPVAIKLHPVVIKLYPGVITLHPVRFQHDSAGEQCVVEATPYDLISHSID